MDLFSISRHGFSESNTNETSKLDAVLKRIEANKRIARKRAVENIEGTKDQPSFTKHVKVEANPTSEIRDELTPPERPDKTIPDLTGFTVLGETNREIKKGVKRVLPKWLANPTVISSDLGNLDTRISEMKILDKGLRKLLKSNGVEHFFPVQSTVIPWILKTHNHSDVMLPRDVCVSSPTGSGKTLCFVLPVVQVLKEYTVKKVRALVILPTQDLANQVYSAFKKYTQNTHLGVALIGGKWTFPQEQKLLIIENEGFGFISKVDIIVCTAGRLVDHLKSTKGLDLQDLEFLIIDEADRVLNSMQNDWLYHLEKHTSKNDSTRLASKILNVHFLHRAKVMRKLLFSATLSQDPEKLQMISMFQPKLFTLVVSETEDSNANGSTFIGKYTTPRELMEKYVVTSEELKPLALYKFIKDQNLTHILVFTHSLESVHRLTHLLKLLSKNKLKVAEISSHLPASSRDELINRFSNKDINILICTDALARGIDLPKVDCVISYNMPKYIKTYIHRVGRTARAGEHGLAVTMVQGNQVNRFKSLLASANKLNIEQIIIPEEEMEPLGDVYKEALHKLKKLVDEENEQNLKKVQMAKAKVKKKNKNKNMKNKNENIE